MSYLRFFVLGLMMLSSCVEPIDFPVDRVGGQLVVDGRITDEDRPHRVRLSVTAQSDRIPIPVENARVRIFDDQGLSESYYPDGETPGVYILAGHTVRGEVGRAYYLEITLADGRTYRSAPEKMPPSLATLDSIYYDFSFREEISEAGIISETPFIDVFIDVGLRQAAQRDVFLRWDVEEVFLLSPTDFPDPFGSIPPPCYVYAYPSASDPPLFDGSGNKAAALLGMLAASQRIDFSFREKHYFTVYQRNLTREAFAYWEKVAALLSNQGAIFDTPPAPVPGNIYNVDDPEEAALGYFEASSHDLIRFRTFREDIPIEQTLECKYDPVKDIRSYPTYCLNCLTIRNSTYQRPDFF